MDAKHIEQITSEQTIGEINRLALSDDMLTTALSKPYADATGLGEVQPSAPVTSDVEEMPSWMTYLLRKMFDTTARVFRGASLLSEFRAVYSWLRDRLGGAADHSIPTVPLDPSKPMSEHLRLLDSRDVYSGANLPDGTSLIRLLCSNLADSVTEIKDSNRWVGGYTSNNSISKRLSCFANLKVLELGCTIIDIKHVPIMDNNVILEEIRFPHLEEVSEADKGLLYNCSALTKAEFPKLKTLYSGWGSNHNYDGLLVQCNAIKRVELPSLVRFENRQSSGSYNCIMYNDAALEELIMPNLSELYHNSNYQHCYCVSLCPSIKKIVLGTLTEFRNVYIVDDKSTELVHVEFGQGTSTNIYLQRWQPSEETIAIPEFLSNFKTYIAQRLTDKGSGLTLTLSQAVRDAIQTDPEIVSIITSKGWTISPAPSV